MKIIVAGDFAPYYRVQNQIEAGCFATFDEVRPVIQSADYSIVNFESPIVIHEAKPIDKTGPSLKCTEKAMACIAHIGFDCVTLANNHFRDYGQVGVEDTLASCLKYDIDFVGGGRNITEAKRILYKDIAGLRLAVINICESEWAIASEEYGGSAPLDPVSNFYVIQEASNNADFVLLIVHGGIEYYQYPTLNMIDTYRFYVDAGADVVINHHQHCISGYEEYKGKPIFYGLGNFCFDKKIGNDNDSWNEGYMVSLEIEINSIKYEILPYVQCDEVPIVSLSNRERLKSIERKVLDINDVIKCRESLKEKFDELLKRIGKYRLSEFEPFDNKYIRALQSRGIIGSLLCYSTLKNIKNIIECESHREVIIGIFHELFKNEKRM